MQSLAETCAFMTVNIHFVDYLFHVGGRDIY